MGRDTLSPLTNHWSHVARGEGAKPRRHADSAPSDPFPSEPIVCIDPTDVHNNTGKACYRVGQIQRLFASAARSLHRAAEREAHVHPPRAHPGLAAPTPMAATVAATVAAVALGSAGSASSASSAGSASSASSAEASAHATGVGCISALLERDLSSLMAETEV